MKEPLQLCQKLQRTNGFMAIIFPNIIYGNYLKALVIYQKLVILKTMVMNLSNFPNNC